MVNNNMDITTAQYQADMDGNNSNIKATIDGKVLNENAGLNSINGAWANSTIDVPSAGTYSYQIRAWRGTGDMQYGETGNIQAPTICAVELVK
jgi:hypothetical protein